tara:strand:- start:23646 stop:24641 length:996 start_codon:yes stop_codon:yes gene_type:complete
MKGILIINLGSPDDLSTSSIKKYLKEFLSDGLVIDYPKFIRKMVVNLFIIPLRIKTTSKAYSRIWSKNGSPLINGTYKLSSYVKNKLNWPVEIAMRYQNPSIKSALEKLIEKGCNEITVLPLYPHYAISSTKTSIKEVKRVVDKNKMSVKLNFIKSFYKDEGYIEALVSVIENHRSPNSDLLLFSYHGIPKRHLRKASKKIKHLESKCLNSECLIEEYCYRHQVYETSRLCAEKMRIPNKNWKVSFQSRIGPGWLEPFTDKELSSLPQKGVRHIDVVCPSFIIDNLETLEEIDIQGRNIFLNSGGVTFNYIPCMNFNSLFIDYLSSKLKKG